MFVSVRLQKDEKGHQVAQVVGIHESLELATEVVKKGTEEKIDVFAWSARNAPQLGETVGIREREIVTAERPGLVSLWEKLFRGSELEDLRMRNEALRQEGSQLRERLENTKEKVYHAQLRRERTHSQFRDLWISVDQRTARENIVADFVRAEMPTLSERIMLAPDAETAAHLNRLGQQNRIKEGEFQPTYGLAYERVLLHDHDRVQFLRADTELRVKDGDLGEIIKLFPERHTAAVSLDSREVTVSELVFVPLGEYADLDLGYATTYERAGKLENIYQAFVLGTHDAPTRELVDSLTARNVEIYTDKLTAYVQFPEIAGKQDMWQETDRTADPLSVGRERN